jgi:Sulfatase
VVCIRVRRSWLVAYGGSYVLSLWMDLTKYSFFCFLPNRLTDGLHPSVGVIAPFRPLPFDPKVGPLMINALPGYWEQDPTGPDSKMCPYFQSVSDELLTAEEKAIACKTQPRTPPKIIDLDLLDKVIEQIKTHDFENTGPLLQVFSTMMLHLPMAYPAEYNEAEANDEYRNGMPEYFASGKIKPPASIDDNRWATNKGVRFVDDLFGRSMQAIKDAGQWNNTIVYFTSDNGGAIYYGTANNNYPLRASKFSPFEGTRQFIERSISDPSNPLCR